MITISWRFKGTRNNLTNDMKLLMGDLNAKVGPKNAELQHITTFELCGVHEFKIGGLRITDLKIK